MDNKDFENELAKLLNRFGMDSACNTPDFILAKYLNYCLANYGVAVKESTDWHNNRKSN